MKSAAQHKLEGTYQKCRQADRGTNLEPVKSLPCPGELKFTRDKWNEVVGALCDSKLVTIADYPLLKDAFINLDLAEGINRRIKEEGGAVEYLANLQGNQVNLIRERQNAMKIYFNIMLKFGVTPVNAAKVRGVKEADSEDASAVTALIGNG